MTVGRTPQQREQPGGSRLGVLKESQGALVATAPGRRGDIGKIIAEGGCSRPSGL